MTLNRIPSNFFLETEQAAFAPSNLISGIEPSEDRLLQGRLFAYADTQLHRVGVNQFQLPINRPLAPVNNYNQDGFSNNAKIDSNINYEPSNQIKLSGDPQYKSIETKLHGVIQQEGINNPRDFYQAGIFYRSLNEQDKKDLIHNLSGDLNKVNDEEIKIKMVRYFYLADENYGMRLAKATHIPLEKITNKRI